MDERATNDDFTPFVPRRLSAAEIVRPHDSAAANPEPVPVRDDTCIAPVSDTDQNVTPLDGALSGTQPSAADDVQPPIAADVSPPAERDDGAAPRPDDREALQPAVCNHDCAIRNEAIRLAIVACGRALRHVALVHPKLVVRYVEEAMAASRSQPEIGSDFETRAELLVRAVADADA